MFCSLRLQGKMVEGMKNMHLETQIQEHAISVFLTKAKVN